MSAMRNSPIRSIGARSETLGGVLYKQWAHPAAQPLTERLDSGYL